MSFSASLAAVSELDWVSCTMSLDRVALAADLDAVLVRALHGLDGEVVGLAEAAKRPGERCGETDLDLAVLTAATELRSVCATGCCGGRCGRGRTCRGGVSCTRSGIVASAAGREHRCCEGSTAKAEQTPSGYRMSQRNQRVVVVNLHGDFPLVVRSANDCTLSERSVGRWPSRVKHARCAKLPPTSPVLCIVVADMSPQRCKERGG